MLRHPCILGDPETKGDKISFTNEAKHNSGILWFRAAYFCSPPHRHNLSTSYGPVPKKIRVEGQPNPVPLHPGYRLPPDVL